MKRRFLIVTDPHPLRATLLALTSLSSLLSGVLLVSTLLAGYAFTPFVAGTAFILSLGQLALTWRGQLLLPRMLVPLFAWLIVNATLVSAQGLNDELILGFPLVIVIAGLLLEKPGVLLYTLLSMLSVTLIGAAEIDNWLTTNNPLPGDPIQIVILNVLLLFTGGASYLSIANLARAVDRARQSESDLAESNRQLQAAQQNLEDRVVERTRYAEAARQEAEDSRQALEEQMWQVSGQAQLGAVLRGEPETADLAARVTAFLCRYLDLPVAALFLQSGSNQEWAGGYACSAAEGGLTSFAPGEGMLGQAALDQCPRLVQDVPVDHLTITTGLGHILPRSVYLLPLVYNLRTVGVLEVGSLENFRHRQTSFLDAAAESLAIAFQSAQARHAFKELLEETQRQAEELQAQEEELRAANEELQARSPVPGR